MTNGQRQSTLLPIYSYSFTAQNLFQVSLVKDQDPNLPDYKRKFFCFLTLAPGQKTDTGRTYNFQNKINMKQDVHQLISLAHALRAVARGQKAMIGNFSLFTDSSKSSYGQGGVKQVFVNEFIKQPQGQQNQQGQGERSVSLGFRSGQNQPMGLMFSVPDALSCADVLEFIGKMGLKMDANASVRGAQAPVNAPPPQTQQRQPQGGGFAQGTGQPPPPQGQGDFNPPPQGQPQGGGPPPGVATGQGAANQAADNFASGMQSAAGFPQGGGPPAGPGGPPPAPPTPGEDDIPF